MGRFRVKGHLRKTIALKQTAKPEDNLITQTLTIRSYLENFRCIYLNAEHSPLILPGFSPRKCLENHFLNR